MIFKKYIGIDYSGAALPTTRSATLQVFMSQADGVPDVVSAPSSKPAKKRNWNRIEIAAWLEEQLQMPEATIVGIDHGMAFPLAYYQRNQLTTWDQFLEHFVHHWPLDSPTLKVQDIRERQTAPSGNATEFRLTETWTSSAKSVFQFDVQGSVAKSTHAGLPFLKRLRDRNPSVHFWPFDGWEIPPGCSVIAETFPSLFRHRYPRNDRKVDQQDAYSISRWLATMDQRGSLTNFFEPPLSLHQQTTALLEGWILGVY